MSFNGSTAYQPYNELVTGRFTPLTLKLDLSPPVIIGQMDAGGIFMVFV